MRHSIGSALRPRSESTKSERDEQDVDLLAHGDAGTRSSVDETEADETIVEPDQNNGGLWGSHIQPLLTEDSSLAYHISATPRGRSIENHTTHVHPRRAFNVGKNHKVGDGMQDP